MENKIENAEIIDVQRKMDVRMVNFTACVTHVHEIYTIIKNEDEFEIDIIPEIRNHFCYVLETLCEIIDTIEDYEIFKNNCSQV